MFSTIFKKKWHAYNGTKPFQPAVGKIVKIKYFTSDTVGVIFDSSKCNLEPYLFGALAKIYSETTILFPQDDTIIRYLHKWRDAYWFEIVITDIFFNWEW